MRPSRPGPGCSEDGYTQGVKTHFTRMVRSVKVSRAGLRPMKVEV